MDWDDPIDSIDGYDSDPRIRIIVQKEVSEPTTFASLVEYGEMLPFNRRLWGPRYVLALRGRVAYRPMA